MHGWMQLKTQEQRTGAGAGRLSVHCPSLSVWLHFFLSFLFTFGPSGLSFAEGGGTEGFPVDVKTVRYCFFNSHPPTTPSTTTTTDTLIPVTLPSLLSSHLGFPVKPLQGCRYDTKSFFVFLFFRSPARAPNCIRWKKEKEKRKKKPIRTMPG